MSPWNYPSTPLIEHMLISRDSHRILSVGGEMHMCVCVCACVCKREELALATVFSQNEKIND